LRDDKSSLPLVQLVLIPGGHFVPYLEEFQTSSAAARDWFLRHL
jgi:hypothetical protein